MVIAYTTKSVKTMDEKIRDEIVNAGLPIEIYTQGWSCVGADNKACVGRAATLATEITKKGLPLPPSRLIELIGEITTNKVSKKDYRISLDGQPGMGKSITGLALGCRYGMVQAERFGQDAKDWFSLDNCALLQDGDGVTKLMDECDKHQCVLIDDAGVSASSRSWQSPENKALGAIMQTCRTKRWFLIYTTPARKMMDNQIRDLVYAKGYIYKSCHEASFNLMKLNATNVNPDDTSGREYKRKFVFDGNKMSFYAIYSPDLLDPYKGMVAKYDAQREKAGSDLIHMKSEENSARKNPVDKVKTRWDEKVEKHYSFVENECMKGGKINRLMIMQNTGLTDRDVVKMIAIYNNKRV